MRRGAMVLLAAFVPALLASGDAGAWVRSKMFDANLPFDPHTPNATMPGWGEDHKNCEIRPGEWIGAGPLGRWCMRITAQQGGADSKAKFTSGGGWTLDPTKVTSVYWGLNILGDDSTLSNLYRIPQIYIRFGSGDSNNPGPAVKVSYDGQTGDGSDVRGWWCQTGARTSGGVDLGGGRWGLPVEPGIWHTVRLTMDPVARTWDLWLNDGDTDDTHMSGTTAGDTGSSRYIQWGKIDSNPRGKTFYTDFIYWGQGAEEIGPNPNDPAGISDPVVNVTPGPTTDTAVVTWNTAVPCDARVVWDRNFYSWSNVESVAESTTSHSVTLTGLPKRTTFSLYCESTEQGAPSPRTWASRIIQFRTSDELTETLGNAGFEEGNDIWPWIDAVSPEGGDRQRWGGVFDQHRVWSGEDPVVLASPLTGKAYSGSMAASYTGRDWACIRQQVATTPGQAYIARAWFRDSFNPGGAWTYQDAMGRIGVDPQGGTYPGEIVALGVFNDAPSVAWGHWVYRPAVEAGWQEASMLFEAESSVATIFLQHHYVAHPYVWLSFDDVSFGPSAVAPPATCAAAKHGQPGWQANPKRVVVTNRTEDSSYNVIGYVEDADRKAGMRVVGGAASWDYSLGVGQEVDVFGVLEVNHSRELEIRATSVRPAASPVSAAVTPLALSNKAVGGGPEGKQVAVENGSGANNTGLLVRVWGRVTGVETEVVNNAMYDFNFFVDDGSGLTAGVDLSTITYPGIEVKVPLVAGMNYAAFVPGRTYVAVTGNSSMKLWDDGDPDTPDTTLKPVIIIRDAADVDFLIL